MLREQIEDALNKVRPSLQADGGDVELVDVDEEGVVKVRLTGACGGCLDQGDHGCNAKRDGAWQVGQCHSPLSDCGRGDSTVR